MAILSYVQAVNELVLRAPFLSQLLDGGEGDDSTSWVRHAWRSVNMLPKSHEIMKEVVEWHDVATEEEKCRTRRASVCCQRSVFG